MKTRLALLSVVTLVLVGLSVAAEAQVAGFQGSTLGFSKNGDFNGTGSSCPGGAAPTQYLWSFVEDGVTRTGNPVTHKFTAPYCAYTVSLTITCSGGSTATKTRLACFSCGVSGCINPDRGYN